MSLKFDATLENARFLAGVKQMRDSIDGLLKDTEKTKGGIEGLVESVKGLAGLSLAGVSFGTLASKVLEVRSYFQDINSTMKTFLGNQEKANEFTEELSRYAYYNMFEFSDLAKASTQLIAYGNDVDNVIDIIDKLSNVATGTGVSLEEMVDSYNKAKSTGALDANGLESWAKKGLVIKDVLKEMGEDVDGSRVSFEQLNRVLDHVTSEGGMFYKLMDSQMNNLSASIGQLEDDLTSMYNEIGESTEGVMKFAIDMTDRLVQNYQVVGKVLATLVVTYGTYKTALLIATAAEGGLQAALKVSTVLTKGLTAANMALNAVLALNPYAMLAAGLAAVATATVLYINSADSLASELERVNNREQEQKDAIDKKKESISESLAVLQDETKTEGEHHEALEKLKAIMPDVFSKYKTEKAILDDLTNARKASNSELEKELKMKGQQNYAEDKEALAFMKEIKRLREQQKSSTYNERRTLQSKIDQMTKSDVFKRLSDEQKKAVLYGRNFDSEMSALSSTVTKGANKLREANNKAWDSMLNTKSKEELQKDIDHNKELLKQIKKQGASAIIEAGNEYSTTEGELRRRIAEGEKRMQQINENANRDYLKEARQAMNKAQKDVQDIIKNRMKYDDETMYEKALKDANEKLESAKKKYKERGGDTSADNKAKTDAENRRKQAQKYAELQAKQGLEAARKEKDIELSTRESRIAVMEEGNKKTIAQINLNFDKQKEDIERGYEDLKLKRIEDAKALWEADPNNKGSKEAFKVTEDMLAYTEEEMANYNAQMDKIERERVRAIASNLEKESQSLNKYLQEYGDYQQKRLAITRDYTERIRKAETEGDKKILTRQMEQALADVDFTEFQESIDWDGVFGNLEYQTNEFLDETRDKLEKMTKSKAFQLMSPTDKKTIEEALDEIAETKAERNPFEGFGDAMEDYKNALVELKFAQLDYENALENGTEAEQENTKATLDAAQAMVQKTKMIAADKMKKVAGKFNEVGDAVTKLQGVFESFGEIDTNGGIGDVISGIGGMLSGISEIWQSILKLDIAGIINGIADTISGVVTTVANLGGLLHVFSSADYSDYNAMKAQYENLISLWDELIRKKKEYLDTKYGADAVEMGNEITETINKQTKAYRELAAERLRSGASTGSHSIAYRINNKNLSDDDWREAKKVLGRGFDDVYDLVDMSGDKLRELMDSAPLFWSKLDDEFRGHLEKIIKGAEEAKDVAESVSKQLTQTSFDNVKSNFITTLMDMEASSDDFADNLSDTFMKAMLSAQIGKKYTEQLEKWYGKFADDMKDGTLSEMEVEQLRSEYMNMVDTALEERDNIAKIVGYKSDNYSQSATAGGFQSMSQDTAEELNGRFTALQISNEGIYNGIYENVAVSRSMLDVMTSSSSMLSDIVDMMAVSNVYLEDIAKYTKNIYSQLGDDLSTISTKLDRI